MQQKKAFFEIKKHLLAALFAMLAVSAANAQRTEVLIDDGWQFSYDRKEWKDVTLPHDYLIGQPWVAPDKDDRGDTKNAAANTASSLSGRAFKELRNGFYRRHITPAAEWKDRRVLIDFEGIMLTGEVFLNGIKIGGTDYGYLGFECDITDRLLWGKENLLEVSAETGQANNSRWYTGGGLYRDVMLRITGRDLFFTRHPLKITTDIITADIINDIPDTDTEHIPDTDTDNIKPNHGLKKENTPNPRKAVVRIAAECRCNTKTRPDSLLFEVCIRDGDKLVAVSRTRKKFYARQRTNEYLLDSILIESPKLWDTETPNLYTATVTVYDNSGCVADQVAETFGIRTIEYGPDFGFRLNGKKTLLKGIANHHTLGALGAAAHEQAIEKRIMLLKAFGVNHIRTSHNPYSESFLRLCDKHGILVVDELYDKWTKQYTGGKTEWSERWQKDIPEWIRRDRNHPCVVMWSLGNELQQMWQMDHADWGVTPYRMQKTLLRRYDETRPVTVAMHPRYRDVDTDSLPAPLALETDIASYNYRYMYFPGDGRRFPWLTFYQSEANTQNIGRNWFEMDLDKVVGLAYWGAIDYLGESQGWPRKGWTLGLFDISLEPKPLAYFMKSYFSDEPMVHLSVFQGSTTGDWNGVTLGSAQLTESWNKDIVAKNRNEDIAAKNGANDRGKVTLYAFSNADEVELLVNGKKLDRQKNDHADATMRNKFIFKDIPYRKGYAEAVAYNDGKVVARHKIETTGEAKRLRLEVEDPYHAQTNSIGQNSDSKGIIHIRVTAIDSKGRRVRGLGGRLEFSAEGAEILAMSNGDNTCDDINVPATASRGEYSMYDGAAMVILRPYKSAQSVQLTAKLKAFSQIKGKYVKPFPGSISTL